MASENNTNQEIDIRRILGVCLRHWYWFVIGVLLCGGLGVLYFLRTTPKYQTQASIMLRQGGDSQIFNGLGGGALDMFGLTMNGGAADEVEVLTSRDLMYQTLDALNLWQSHRYKDGLRRSEEHTV